ncbi:class I SAM-dependent methyltransferase [Burkholderia gladioli]|uniref:class I SAM-dependent methyltransferase n=1 Tax=Burkholderia gladioli TaxID=28095 RepID=UPI0016416A10|nr:methyltransferase domain-containing protein [Burkholderia gladioli]
MSNFEMAATSITFPKKLNIGCGFDKKAGFLNVDLNDFHNPDLIADACDLSALPSEHFDYILAQDILEHLERSKTCVALTEWSRVLSPSGCIDIRIPSVLGMFELLSKPENRHWQNAEKIIHLMYGTQAYTGDYHLAGFTAEILVEYLRRAGLIVRKAELKDEWLFHIEAVKIGELHDAADLVHNAFFEVLGRPADPDGLDSFVKHVRATKMPLDAIKNVLRESDEFSALEKMPSYLRHLRNHFKSRT